jgi:hypothetical protein
MVSHTQSTLQSLMNWNVALTFWLPEKSCCNIGKLILLFLWSSYCLISGKHCNAWMWVMQFQPGAIMRQLHSSLLVMRCTFWCFLPSEYLVYRLARSSRHQKNVKCLPYFNPDKLKTCVISLGDFYTYCWWYLVVLYTYHHFILHCQSSSLPHSWADDHTHWKCWGFGRTNWDFVWNSRKWIHYDIFQGKTKHPYVSSSNCVSLASGRYLKEMHKSLCLFWNSINIWLDTVI